jgi:hypothetical protein
MMSVDEYLRGYAAGYRAALADAVASPSSPTPAARKPARAPARRRMGAVAPPVPPPAPLPESAGKGGMRQRAILQTLQECADQDPTPPTTAELAETMGISPNYLYRALPALLRQGKVRAHVTTADGVQGVLEPGTDVEGRRDLLGVMPRWSYAAEMS